MAPLCGFAGVRVLPAMDVDEVQRQPAHGDLCVRQDEGTRFRNGYELTSAFGIVGWRMDIAFYMLFCLFCSLLSM